MANGETSAAATTTTHMKHLLHRVEVDLAEGITERCTEAALKGLEQLLASYAAFDEYLREREAGHPAWRRLASQPTTQGAHDG